MSSPPPQLAILIPNFNNGRESSRDGDRNFIEDLFQSIQETLEDDPTPVEIIVADDGSTDDSLETCREWASRTWRGKPFCTLTEFPHSGCLSQIANQLTAAASAPICCRLDGDIIIQTRNWAQKIIQTFQAAPQELGVIGPLQLGLDGQVHAFGSWILHPRGHHHHGQGFAPGYFLQSIEVDHVMGCFYIHKRKVWEDLGGYDETILRGQTVDFGLRARRNGWRTFAVPHIQFIHAHAARARRQNAADTDDGLARTRERFFEIWGFDRLAPDLDVVRQKYAGTPLLWNARVFGPQQISPQLIGAPTDSPPTIQNSAWSRFTVDPAFKQEVTLALELIQNQNSPTGDVPESQQIAIWGTHTGLLAHLAAKQGSRITGIESNPEILEFARATCASQSYASHPPEFMFHPVDHDQKTSDSHHHPESSDEPTTIPQDFKCESLLIVGILERHPNPVRALSQAARWLKPNGRLHVLTEERRSIDDALPENIHRYRPHEMIMQINALQQFDVETVTMPRNVPGRFIVHATRIENNKIQSHPRNETPESAGLVATH